MTTCRPMNTADTPHPDNSCRSLSLEILSPCRVARHKAFVSYLHLQPTINVKQHAGKKKERNASAPFSDISFAIFFNLSFLLVT